MDAIKTIPDNLSLIARAVEIADDDMRILIECECRLVKRAGQRFYGILDDNDQEVATIAEASQSIRRAFEYLNERGLAELVEGGEGMIRFLGQAAQAEAGSFR